MPTVTSENKAQFDKEFMEKRSNSTMSDPASYKSFARDAAKQSEKAETAAQHHEAMGSHKHAAMFAKPHPVHKEHEEKAKFHAAEHRKMQRLEQNRYINEREANAAAANRKSMVKKGIVAGSNSEKENLPMYKGQQ
jgi:hypothetical protein